jgi:hypothetical protein
MLLHIDGKFKMKKLKSSLNRPNCPFRGVGQGVKQTYLYLWYNLFQAQWDICDQRNHQL